MGKLSERIERANDTGRPVGNYVVELADAHSGRVVERMEKENYITELWEKHHLSAQYGNPYYSYGLSNGTVVYTGSGGFYNTNGAPFGDRVYGPGVGIPIPMDSVMCTDWTSPEDPGVHWGRGRVAAWATRWKATVSASGLRGQINEAQCLFSNNGLTHKTVWDWTTDQGNGTFQTVMLGGAFLFGNPAVQGPICMVGPEIIFYGVHAYPNIPVISNIWVDGSTSYFIAPASNSATANLTIYSMATTAIFEATRDPKQEWVRDGSAATVTSVCATGLALSGEPANINSTSASPYNRCTMGLAKISGGDFLITWIGMNGTNATSANGRKLWFRRISTAGTQVVANTQFGDTASENIYWSGTDFNNSSQYPAASISSAFDGTFLYVHAGCGPSFGAGVKTKIYRVNIADGTLSTTINYPTNFTSCTDGGIVLYDGDLLVSTLEGIIRLDTGGTPVHPYNYGSIACGQFGIRETGVIYDPVETGSSPFSTTAGFYRGSRGQGLGIESRREEFGRWPVDARPFGFNTNLSLTAATSVNGYQTNFARGNMVVYNDELWVMQFGNATTSTLPFRRTDAFPSTFPAALMRVNGANMFSRVLLPSPATKTSSQTMRISYELTIPDPYALSRIPAANDLTESTGLTS
jgi:hypothetical protein